MAEHGYFLGEGGGKPIRMSLPLPEPMQQQLTKGYLRRVNADGSEFREPAEQPPGGPPEVIVDGPPPPPPPQSATKPEWVGYAVRAHGVKPDDAEALTKQDLIDRYGQPAQQ